MQYEQDIFVIELSQSRNLKGTITYCISVRGKGVPKILRQPYDESCGASYLFSNERGIKNVSIGCTLEKFLNI